MLIIAERVSTVKDSDQSLALEDGEIKGMDTHDKLLKTNESYQEISQTQQKGVSE